MSMYEPDDAEWMQAGDESPEQAMWVPPGDNSQPFWGVPSRPPPRPPTGQLPGRPVWPFWGYWGYRLRNAQRDIKYLAEVVNDILDARLDNLSKTGVPGVTDGSAAPQGSIGELLIFDSPLLSYTGTTTISQTAGILPPGDWDVYGWVGLPNPVAGCSVTLNPLPLGFSAGMGGWIGVSPGTESTNLVLVPSAARVSVPTLMPFQISIVATAAGSVQLHVQARRRR